MKRMKRRPAGNGMDLESVGKEREEKMARGTEKCKRSGEWTVGILDVGTHPWNILTEHKQVCWKEVWEKGNAVVSERKVRRDFDSRCCGQCCLLPYSD